MNEPATYFLLVTDDYDDGYDIEPDTKNNADDRNIYGDINEEPEFRVVQLSNNPYYGDGIELGTTNETNGETQADVSNADVVTRIENLYYE